MAHTEEPWEMITPEDGWVAYTGDEDIGILADGGLIAEVFQQIGEGKVADVGANARLMVNAPRMFRALVAASGTINPGHCKGCEIAFTEIQQVIASVKEEKENELG